MPLAARAKIAAYVLVYLLGWGALCWVAAKLGAPGYLLALLVLLATAGALLALDAFYPKCNLFLPALVHLPSSPRAAAPIALSFDDGPVAPYTGEILEILQHYQVKASFFCIGANVEQEPELARAILAAGHTLGNHTQSHRNLMLAAPTEIAREVDACQHSIYAATGHHPRLFRCPKGYKSPQLAWVLRRRPLCLVGYSYPIWDVQNPPPEELVDRVLSRAASGDIVVMHDGYVPGREGRRDSLVAALPAIIEGLRGRGLTPVPLHRYAP